MLVAAALIGVHLLAAHEGPRWASPLLIGDWLFTVAFALGMLLYSLDLGRWVAAPLLGLDQDRLLERLAAIGLGFGVLSTTILCLGFLRLLYPPVFLALWLAYTAWRRHQLWAIVEHGWDATAHWMRSGFPTAPNLGQRAVLVVLTVALLHVALRTMLPTSDWDAVTYHLAAPKIYLGQHMIVPLPDLPLAMAPSDEEMVLMSGLAAGTDGLGKVLMVAFTLLLGLATYGLARRLCHAAAGWIAVLALFSMVWLVGVMPLTLTDGAGSFLLVVGVIDLVAWAEGRERSRERRSDQLSGSDEPPGSASILLAPVDASGGRSGRWAWLPWGAVRSFLALTRQCEQDARAPRRGLRAERTYGGEPDTRVRVSRVPRRSLHAGSTTGTSETLALPGVPGQYRRLMRAGLLVGLAGAVKMTNLPAIPALVGTVGVLSLFAPGASARLRLGDAVVAGLVAGSAAMAAVGIWLLKSWFFFGRPLYPNSLQVSNPSQGVTIAAVPVSTGAHLRWMGETLGNFLVHQVGLLALAVVLAPLLWRRPGPRALASFLAAAMVLWLLYVPAFDPPRYYLALAALCLALAVTDIYHLGAWLRIRSEGLDWLLSAAVMLQALPVLTVGLSELHDPDLLLVARGGISRYTWLGAHVRPYLAEEWVNEHAAPGGTIALVNVLPGYYMNRPYLTDWYASRFARLESGPASRKAEFTLWCGTRVRYAVFDRGDGVPDFYSNNIIRPLSSFAWTRAPGLAAHALYSAHGVDVLMVSPCAASHGR